MHHSFVKFAALIVLTSAGCSAPAPWVDYPVHGGRQVDPREASKVPVANEAATVPEYSNDDAAQPSEPTPAANPTELASVLDELDELREIDPELYQSLKQELRETDPTLWPLLAKTIRATLAYRDEKPDSATQAEKIPAADPTVPDSNPLRSVAAVQGDVAAEPKVLDSLRAESPASRLLALDSEPASAASGAAESTERVFISPPEPLGIVKSDGTTLGTPGADVTSNAPQEWMQSVEQAINQLEVLAAQGGNKDEQARLQSYLRLLYLTAERRDDAVRPIEGVDQMQSEFWTHLMHGLGFYLDEEGTPVEGRRAALALRQLRQASDRLAATSTLDVRNLAFCTRVDSFGRYERFDPYAFAADQEMLLYVEVDNFHVKEGAGSFSTELQGSYQIFDPTGRRVADHSFQLEKETCRNRRRDYFIAYRMWLPQSIYPGEYTLQLTIEDVAGSKSGQSTIDFAIRK